LPGTSLQRPEFFLFIVDPSRLPFGLLALGNRERRFNSRQLLFRQNGQVCRSAAAPPLPLLEAWSRDVRGGLGKVFRICFELDGTARVPMRSIRP
jgi:hypothetical protein